MPNYLKSDYQLNYARYKHYYRQIWKFYSKPVVKVSSALLLTIFTTIFFAVFAIRPTLTTVAELLKTIEDQEEVLGKLKKKAASLATAQTEYDQNADAIEILNQAIPQDKEIQDLILMIEATAGDHQLVINSYKVGEFEYRQDPSLPDTVTIPLNLSLQATYAQLKDFTHDLSRLPRFLSIDSISFSQPDERQQGNIDLDQDAIDLSLKFAAHYMPLPQNNNSQE